MPPTSAIRRGPPPPPEQPRRQSVRQARTSTTRPTSYYARDFAYTAPAVEVQENEVPQGFFPGIHYFTDAITALPKEVMRHVTLIKEVEAKVYGPTQIMTQLAGKILDMPVPPRRNRQPSRQALLSFTANNSTTASQSGSVINGSGPGLAPHSSDHDDASSQAPPIDPQADFARRQEFHNMRMLIQSMIVNLDEKNVVMAEANRTLERQLARMDSAMPWVVKEFSEEAMFGSLDHWAYADNRVKKPAVPTTAERSHRANVAATGILAAAATKSKEADIAEARGEARREAKKSRHQQLDSEFEDRPAPKKAQPGKGRKAADISETMGLGIMNGATNGQPQKRRRVEKIEKVEKGEKVGAVAMERSASGVKNAKVPRETSRSTPAVEPIKKKPKPILAPPATKKRGTGVNSPLPSPRVASSPQMGSFGLLNEVRPSSSARNRQTSSTLQYSTLADKSISRPPSAAETKAANGTGSRSHRNSVAKNKDLEEAHGEEMDVDGKVEDAKTESGKAINARQGEGSVQSATDDTGGEVSVPRGRTSRVATPQDTTFHPIEMVRTRSNGVRNLDHMRNAAQKPGARNGDRTGKTRHSRSASGTHILKQIASFNRSPVMSKRELASGDEEDSAEADDEPEPVERSRSRGSEQRSVQRMSRRSQRARSPDEEVNEDVGDREAGFGADEGEAEVEAEPEMEVELEEEDENAGDPDDENEPKYCYCGRGSYGTMIACENEACVREWFHLECTGLKTVPSSKVDWFCNDCDPKIRKKARPAVRQ